MTDKTSKTTSTAVARPMSATELQNAALTTVPNYNAAVAALAAVDARLAELHVPDPAPVDAAAITALLLAGESLPDDLGTVIRTHADRTAARHHEVQLLGAVHDAIERRREAAIRTGADAAFGWLGQHLHALVEAGRKVLDRLGTVRTAEAALDADDPAQARDVLRALRACAAEHEVLREAQVHLVGVVATMTPGTRYLAWSEQVRLVADHGLVANPGAAGTPPSDPHARWLWLLEGPAVADVPTYRELLHRADAAQPAKPPRPATIEGEQEPYLTGPGTDAQRAQRLRTRVGLGPVT